jgi:hypothetical protein
MEGGGLVPVTGLGGAGVGEAAVVVVFGRGAISSFAGAVLTAGEGEDFGAGGWTAGFEAEDLGPGEVGAGGTDVCPAAILHAASDSATKQTGRSTRFM